MLVKVFSRAFRKWEEIGICLEMDDEVLKDLKDKWRSKEELRVSILSTCITFL